MEHYFTDVPKLGNVAVSRHAQERIKEENISPEEFRKTLFEPTAPDVQDGPEIIWRERHNVRLVILLQPQPYRGAKLVKTVFRVQGQASTRRHK